MTEKRRPGVSPDPEHGRDAHATTRTAAVLLARLALGGVLFYAGFLKLKNGWQFAESIANFRMLPAQANQILAVVLPWVEVSAGALLVFGVWVRAAGILAGLMFAAFLVAISAALYRGLDIECGCFGTGAASRVGLHALAFDLLWLAAAGLVLWLTPREAGQDVSH
jgi:uncharacterized membrane protein YphA (DoxX/SURF4 family)